MAKPSNEHKKICKYCKTKFVTNYIRSVFCSKKCSYKHGREKLLKEKKDNPQKFIDRKHKYRKKIIEKKLKNNEVVLGITKKKCKICNKLFLLKKGVSKYCSEKCKHQAELNRLRKRKDIIKDKKNEHWRNFYRRMKGYEPVKEIKCIICKKIFLRQSIDQKYCNNEECKLEFLRRKARENYKNKKHIFRERYLNNINAQIKTRLSTRIRCALKSNGTEKCKRTVELIGCSIKELRKHLEKQFKPGMTWKNNNLHGWHIDHIIPCKLFNLTKIEEQLKCFHYTNLQPLWAKQNLQKSGKYKNES